MKNMTITNTTSKDVNFSDLFLSLRKHFNIQSGTDNDLIDRINSYLKYVEEKSNVQIAVEIREINNKIFYVPMVNFL